MTIEQPRLFDVGDVRPHPCPFPDAVIDVFIRMLPTHGVVLDPFAGTGGIHRLATATRRTIGVELEPEWARWHPNTIIANAVALPFPDATFAGIGTSPDFGNRLADRSVRPDARTVSYAHSLGRQLSHGNGAALRWGPEYRVHHMRAIAEMIGVARPGAPVLVEMQDHVRDFEVQHVVGWWCEMLQRAGARFLHAVDVDTGGLAHLNPNYQDCLHVVLVHEVGR